MSQRLPLLAPRVPRPRLCVWEITRACNGLCIHCGSSAGKPRDNELSTAEALALIDQLALLGCQTVTFSGGEPLMREDWPVLVRRVRERGLRAELMSNGMLVSAQLDAIVDAGFASVSLSMDGPAEIHDALRGVRGNHARMLAGARALSERGMRVGAVTQVGRLNVRHLDAINEMLVEAGFQGWLVQLTLTYGRAAEHGERLALDPEELPLLEAELLRVIERSPLRIQAADTIGYFSAAEPRLRASADCGSGFWGSCQLLRKVALS